MPDSSPDHVPAPDAPRRQVRHYRRLASDSDEAVDALVDALVADLFGDEPEDAPVVPQDGRGAPLHPEGR